MFARIRSACATNREVFVHMHSDDFACQRYLELTYFNENSGCWEERSSWYSQLDADYQGWYTIEHARIPSTARDIRIRFGVRAGHQPTFAWRNGMWTGERDVYFYANPAEIKDNIFCLAGPSFHCAVVCTACSSVHAEAAKSRLEKLARLDALIPHIDEQWQQLTGCMHRPR